MHGLLELAFASQNLGIGGYVPAKRLAVGLPYVVDEPGVHERTRRFRREREYTSCSSRSVCDLGRIKMLPFPEERTHKMLGLTLKVRITHS